MPSTNVGLLTHPFLLSIISLTFYPCSFPFFAHACRPRVRLRSVNVTPSRTPCADDAVSVRSTGSTRVSPYYLFAVANRFRKSLAGIADRVSPVSFCPCLCCSPPAQTTSPSPIHHARPFDSTAARRHAISLRPMWFPVGQVEVVQLGSQG